jgi:hypothetical protein
MRKIFFYFTLSALVGAGGYYMAFKAYEGAKSLYHYCVAEAEAMMTTERIVHVAIPEKEKSFSEIILATARKYRLPKLLILALIEQESGRSMRSDRVRFEPEVFKRLKRRNGETEEEARLWASSLGLGQVIPFYHADKPECGGNLGKYFEPEHNLNCAGAVLRECLDYHGKIADKYSRMHKALECYNGGPSYPGQVLERVARLTIEGTDL